MTKINVALTVSSDWIQYAAVTAASIISNADMKDEYHFYILSDSFTAKDKAMFRKLKSIKSFKINYIQMDDSEFDEVVHD